MTLTEYHMRKAASAAKSTRDGVADVPEPFKRYQRSHAAQAEHYWMLRALQHTERRTP